MFKNLLSFFDGEGHQVDEVHAHFPLLPPHVLLLLQRSLRSSRPLVHARLLQRRRNFPRTLPDQKPHVLSSAIQRKELVRCHGSDELFDIDCK